MKSRAAFVIVLLTIVVNGYAGYARAQGQAPERPEAGHIEIAIDGERRVSLVPREKPDGEQMSSVLVPVEVAADLFVPREARPIGALEAVAWREKDGARVLLYGLSDIGVPSSKRFLASVLVEWDTTAEFQPLDLFGVQGVSFRAGPPPRR